MQLNEAGQVLLPLTGLNKEILYSLFEKTEVGLMFNDTKAEKYNIFIFTSKNKAIEDYLNKVSKVTNFEDKGLLKRLYSIECKEDYKMDWRNIMKGKYSLVNRTTVNNNILPTLKGNRKAWKEVFNQDDSGLIRVIERKFPNLQGEKLRKVVNDTIEDIKKVKLTMELKEPLKIIENTIKYEH